MLESLKVLQYACAARQLFAPEGLHHLRSPEPHHYSPTAITAFMHNAVFFKVYLSA